MLDVSRKHPNPTKARQGKAILSLSEKPKPAKPGTSPRSSAVQPLINELPEFETHTHGFTEIRVKPRQSDPWPANECPTFILGIIDPVESGCELLLNSIQFEAASSDIEGDNNTFFGWGDRAGITSAVIVYAVDSNSQLYPILDLPSLPPMAFGPNRRFSSPIVNAVYNPGNAVIDKFIPTRRLLWSHKFPGGSIRDATPQSFTIVRHFGASGYRVPFGQSLVVALQLAPGTFLDNANGFIQGFCKVQTTLMRTVNRSQFTADTE